MNTNDYIEDNQQDLESDFFYLKKAKGLGKAILWLYFFALAAFTSAFLVCYFSYENSNVATNVYHKISIGENAVASLLVCLSLLLVLISIVLTIIFIINLAKCNKVVAASFSIFGIFFFPFVIFAIISTFISYRKELKKQEEIKAQNYLNKKKNLSNSNENEIISESTTSKKTSDDSYHFDQNVENDTLDYSFVAREIIDSNIDVEIKLAKIKKLCKENKISIKEYKILKEELIDSI